MYIKMDPGENMLKKNSLQKTGKVIAVSISKKKGIPKSNVKSADLIENYGIQGDVHAGSGRQVSFLAIESINKIRGKGLPGLRPGAFAENITTEFLDLPSLLPGTKIQIGGNAVIEVTQIGKVCHAKCAIYVKTGDCVMPSEGIFGRVINSGRIEAGDLVKIINEPV